MRSHHGMQLIAMGTSAALLVGLGMTSILMIMVEPVPSSAQTPVIVLILTVVCGFLATLSQQLIQSYNLRKQHEADVLERKERAEELAAQTKATVDMMTLQNEAVRLEMEASTRHMISTHTAHVEGIIDATANATIHEVSKQLSELKQDVVAKTDSDKKASE